MDYRILTARFIYMNEILEEYTEMSSALSKSKAEAKWRATFAVADLGGEG